jgi:hypothetical protein
MIGLVELLKSMNFADDDDDELDLRILDDRQQTTNKRSDQITKIPDRLIFLIVRFSSSSFSSFDQRHSFRFEFQEFFVQNAKRSIIFDN